MRSLSFLRTFALALVLMSSAMYFQSCGDTTCDTVTCQNGGDCKDGVCECPEGFTGEFCECPVCPDNSTCNSAGECECDLGYEANTAGDACVAIRSRTGFLGSYVAEDVCAGLPALPTYTVVVSADVDSIHHFLIENFGNITTSGAATPIDVTARIVGVAANNEVEFVIDMQNPSEPANQDPKIEEVYSEGNHGRFRADGSMIIEYAIKTTYSNNNSFLDHCTLTLE